MNMKIDTYENFYLIIKISCHVTHLCHLIMILSNHNKILRI